MMDSDELRRAVELAGLQWFEGQFGSMVNTGFSTMFIEDPALIPYVASLLVADVRADGIAVAFFDNVLDDMNEPPRHFNSATTDERRIRAAVAALEATNTEQGEGND
jgi:hypothetical protein